jgi:diguanylate cyclase (GGDEF)-like protein
MSLVAAGAQTGPAFECRTARFGDRLIDRTRFLDHVERALGRNDTLGRDVTLLTLSLDPLSFTDPHVEWGDEVHAVTAARLIGCLHHTTVVARISGDEFAVLAEGQGGLAGAAELAAHMREAVCRPDGALFATGRLTVSIGIARHEPHIAAELLLVHADRAMRVARQEGGGRWQVFEEWMAGSSATPAR